ncbi:MAG: SPW repeat protein, partial [archaeon]
MATEQPSTVTTESGSLAKWARWLAGLVGLWVLASPFVLSGEIAEGTPMWSNVVGGLAILILAAYGAYAIRSLAETATNTAGEWSGWIAAIAGLWIGISPFVLEGSITEGNPMFSNVVAGLLALVLAAYAGYSLRERSWCRDGNAKIDRAFRPDASRRRANRFRRTDGVGSARGAVTASESETVILPAAT